MYNLIYVFSVPQDLETASYNGPKKGAALFAELCPDKNSSILDCGAGSGLSGEGVRMKLK